MAHSFTVVPIASSLVDGRRHMAWEITQVETPEEGKPGWCLHHLPVYFTLTVFHAKVTVGGGTLQPRLATAADATPQDLDHVVLDEGGMAFVQNNCPVRVLSPCGRLFGWAQSSVPNATVVFRISIVEGH